jgi:hypothetical protein
MKGSSFSAVLLATQRFAIDNVIPKPEQADFANTHPMDKIWI